MFVAQVRQKRHSRHCDYRCVDEGEHRDKPWIQLRQVYTGNYIYTGLRLFSLNMLIHRQIEKNTNCVQTNEVYRR